MGAHQAAAGIDETDEFALTEEIAIPAIPEHTRRALVVIDEQHSKIGDWLPVVGFAGVGLVWVGLVTWAALDANAGRTMTAPALASWLSLACNPLVLLALAYMLWQRTSRREAARFARTAEAMRQESQRLESVLAQIAVRTENHRAAVAAQASQLLQLGEEAGGRLALIGETMRQGTAALAKQAALLDGAAEAARNDMGALLADLPRAEAQARDLSETLRQAGIGAHDNLGALDAQLAQLVERGREVDEVTGGGAKRLAAHVARLRTVSETASQQLELAAATMTTAVDGALSRAAQAFDETRRGMDSQGAAMLAMAEQSEAAIARTGLDASAAMTRRIEDINAHIDQLSAKLSAQDAASQTLISAVAHGLAELDARFAAVGEGGTARTETLRQAILALGSDVEQLSAALGSGDGAAAALTDRAGALRGALDSCIVEIDQRLPEALGRVEAQVSASRSAVDAAGPGIAQLEASARTAAETLATAEAAIERQQAGIAGLLQSLDERLAEAQARAVALGETIGGADGQAKALVEGSAVQLVDALSRVREVSQQAAERAREALSSVVTESAAALGEASRHALETALTDRVEAQMGRIAATAEGAVGSAQRATERLMSQMMTIAETTAAIETRIADAREEVAQADSNSFSRRVALLIESLNSTAIDVTKILSNDVTDAAWASYLKGDRGIFTRRAVKLIDAGEAREIARHYDSEPEFREQVNRYIHDFEAMLRDILANRDGTPLGVTLLSSDMGKLYVALAQAIERLRT